jgi:hypothetical protein
MKAISPAFTLAGRLATDATLVLTSPSRNAYSAETAWITLDEHATVELCTYSPGCLGWSRRSRAWCVARGPVEVDVAALRADLRPGGALYEAVQRVIAGHTVEWDGQNMVGRMTPDAADAEAEIESYCSHDDRYATRREVWDAAEWLYEFASDTLTGDEDADALEALAAECHAAADSDHVVLTGSVRDVLTEVRDTKRAQSGQDE